MQNKAAKVILGLSIMYSANDALQNLHLLIRRRRHRCVAVYKCLNDLMKVEFDIIKNSMVYSYSTRRKNNLHLPKAKTEWGKQCFAFHAAKDWNELDLELKSVSNYKVFKRKLLILN